MKNAQVQTFINKIKNELSESDFPIDGFHFSLSDPENFDPYTDEACKIAGFYQERAPSPQGFFYCSSEYQDYLEVLKDNNVPHPANFDNLDWIFTE